MNNFWLAIMSFSLALMTFAVLTVLHVGMRIWARRSGRRFTQTASTCLAWCVGICGPVFLWRVLDISVLRIGSIFLYFTFCIIYIEIQSLLSRGYSLRILLDLLKSEGQVSVKELESGYGEGMGLEGLLKKRLRTLARLHLLHFEASRVGPLTLIGTILAIFGSGVRRLLRLERVG